MMDSILKSYTSISVPETTGFSEQRLVPIELGPFDVTVAISGDGKFLGIFQIAEKRDFRSLRQRIESSSYADVSDLYIDDPNE